VEGTFGKGYVLLRKAPVLQPVHLCAVASRQNDSHHQCFLLLQFHGSHEGIRAGTARRRLQVRYRQETAFFRSESQSCVRDHLHEGDLTPSRAQPTYKIKFK